LVVQSGGDGGDLGRIAATFFSGDARSPHLTSALLFRKRKQKDKDTQSREDRRGDEASRRNLSARVKTHFQLSGDTD
jgi:hypothetical protein